MPKYKTEIIETLQYQGIIDADDEQDAISKLREKYYAEEIILNEENHVSTEFKVIKKVRKRDRYER